MEDILEHQPLPPPPSSATLAPHPPGPPSGSSLSPPPPHSVKRLVPRNANSEYYRKYSVDCENKGFAKHLLQKEKVEAVYFIKEEDKSIGTTIAKKLMILSIIVGILLCVILPPLYMKEEINKLQIEYDDQKKEFEHFKDFATPILVDHQGGKDMVKNRGFFWRKKTLRCVL